VAGGATGSSKYGDRGLGRGRGGACNGNQVAWSSTLSAANFTIPPPPIQSGQVTAVLTLLHGNCPNTAATCTLPSGTRLTHKCDVCNGNHPRVQHR